MNGCQFNKKKFKVGGYNPVYEKGWLKIFNPKTKLRKFINKILEFDYDDLLRYLLLLALLGYLILIKTC